MNENTIFHQPVGWEKIQELNQILQKYKAGKVQLPLPHRKIKLMTINVRQGGIFDYLGIVFRQVL